MPVIEQGNPEQERVSLPLPEQVDHYIEAAAILGVSLVPQTEILSQSELGTICHPVALASLGEDGAHGWGMLYYHIRKPWLEIIRKDSGFPDDLRLATRVGLDIVDQLGWDRPAFKLVSVFGGPLKAEPRLVQLANATKGSFPERNPFAKTYLVLPGATTNPGPLGGFIRFLAGSAKTEVVWNEAAVISDVLSLNTRKK